MDNYKSIVQCMLLMLGHLKMAIIDFISFTLANA